MDPGTRARTRKAEDNDNARTTVSGDVEHLFVEFFSFSARRMQSAPLDSRQKFRHAKPLATPEEVGVSHLSRRGDD